ncbi:MAG TPA: acyl-CoA carboxylase epsilon subunit [Actinocrinis sp.]
MSEQAVSDHAVSDQAGTAVSQLSQIVVLRGEPAEAELAALIAVLMARRATGDGGDPRDGARGLEPARWRPPGYAAANSWRT